MQNIHFLPTSVFQRLKSSLLPKFILHKLNFFVNNTFLFLSVPYKTIQGVPGVADNTSEADAVTCCIHVSIIVCLS